MSNISASAAVRRIDHLVIASSKLDALAKFYAALGFQVGPKNRHPWGTENHIVQFDGVFLELIGVGEGARIPERTEKTFSFGAFVRDFIAGGDGMAMLALESHNAVGDALDFRRARIGDFDTFHFERKGVGADGKPTLVSFTLAAAEMTDAPRAGFFTCQQHQPQNFWSEAKQRHANGASGVAQVVLVDDDPSDHHEFLGAFLNQREMKAVSDELELATGRGVVSVLSPAMFRFRFGVEPPPRRAPGPRFAAVTLTGAEPGFLTQALGQNHIAHHRHRGLLVVPHEAGHGVVLAFAEPAA